MYNPNPADQRGIWVFGASPARVYPVELGDSSAVRLTAIDGGLLAAAFFKSPSDGDTSSAGTIQVGTTRQEIAPGPDYLVTFRP